MGSEECLRMTPENDAQGCLQVGGGGGCGWVGGWVGGREEGRGQGRGQHAQRRDRGNFPNLCVGTILKGAYSYRETEGCIYRAGIVLHMALCTLRFPLYEVYTSTF